MSPDFLTSLKNGVIKRVNKQKIIHYTGGENVAKSKIIAGKFKLPHSIDIINGFLKCLLTANTLHLIRCTWAVVPRDHVLFVCLCCAFCSLFNGPQ